MKHKGGLQFKPETAAGVVSCGCFICEVVLFLVCIGYSVYRHGNGGLLLGLLGVGILLLAMAGTGTAVNGLLAKEKRHRLSGIGLGLNLLSAAAVLAVYAAGVMALL